MNNNSSNKTELSAQELEVISGGATTDQPEEMSNSETSLEMLLDQSEQQLKTYRRKRTSYSYRYSAQD